MTTSEDVFPIEAPDSLDAEQFLSKASAQTRLDDFGDFAPLFPRFSKLVDAANKEAALDANGAAKYADHLVGLLVQRLWMQQDLTEHPEIRDEVLLPPIVVTGLLRSGTTKMQRILSQDPGVQRLAHWRLIHPAPIRGTQRKDPDPRIAIAEEAIQAKMDLIPDYQLAHPTFAQEVDEDCFLLQLGFASMFTCLRVRVPSYWAWLKEREDVDAHAELRLYLQYLQWQDGGARGRPWVLKSPVHLEHIGSFLDAFPGSTVVTCHRDPVTAMASGLRLVEVGRRQFTDEIDLPDLGREVLLMWSELMEKYVAQRDEIGVSPQFVEARYRTICDDPYAIVREVYERRETPFSDETETRIRSWEADNPQHGHGRFSYSLDRFSLTPDDIEGAFGGYLKAYQEEGT